MNASHVVMLSPFLFLMLVSGICMYNDIVSKVISFQIRMLPTFDSIIFVSVDEMPEFLANFLNKNYRRDISGDRGASPISLSFFKKQSKTNIHHKRQNQFKIQRGDCRTSISIIIIANSSINDGWFVLVWLLSSASVGNLLFPSLVQSAEW